MPFSPLITIRLLSVTTPILIASATAFSNAAAFSSFTVTRKRDCVSLNKAVTADPEIVTSAPRPSAPNAFSQSATANPPSDKSVAD